MGSRGRCWDLPCVEAFDLPGCRCRRTGKGIQVTEKRSKKWMGSCWRDGYTYRAQSVSLSRNVTQWSVTFSALKLECELALEYGPVKRWESKILRLTFRPKTVSRRGLGGIPKSMVEGDEDEV